MQAFFRKTCLIGMTSVMGAYGCKNDANQTVSEAQKDAAAAPTATLIPAPSPTLTPSLSPTISSSVTPTPSPTTAVDINSPMIGVFASSTSVTSAGFTLHWTAASDDITPVVSLEYRVCSGADATAIDTVEECETATSVLPYTANALSVTTSGLPVSSIFYYNVVVKDAAGNKTIYSGKSQATSGAIIATNIHAHQVVETGFMVGTASSGAVAACQFDDGDIVLATGTATWKCSLPHGTNTWKLNSSHTIKFGTFDGGTIIGDTTLTVTKGNNKDLNGDGYVDNAVGAVQYTGGSAKGRAYVFYSRGSTGYAATVGAGSANSVITGEADSDSFGTSLALADITGDGYADLIVGAMDANAHAGKVYVFYSSPGGLAATIAASAADSVLIGAAADDQFGVSVAAGDINGDGYADVAVGAFGYAGSAYQGRAYLFHSSSSGIGATVAANAANSVVTGSSDGDSFGNAIAIADVNGDGYADFIAGAPYYNASSGKGRIYVFHSSSTGFATSLAANSANSIFTGPADGSVFGYSLAVADVNGDGHQDLVASAMYTNSGYIFHSTSSGFPSAVAAASAHSVLTGHNGSLFGVSVAAGDVNGDGYQDVLVGASNFDASSNKGQAYLFLSSSSGLGATVGVAAANSTLTGISDSDYFANALTIGDTNGDGYGDVVITSYGYDASLFKGRVHVFSASPTGLAGPNIAASSANSIWSGESNGDYFGYAVGR